MKRWKGKNEQKEQKGGVGRVAEWKKPEKQRKRAKWKNKQIVSFLVRAVGIPAPQKNYRFQIYLFFYFKLEGKVRRTKEIYNGILVKNCFLRFWPPTCLPDWLPARFLTELTHSTKMSLSSGKWLTGNTLSSCISCRCCFEIYRYPRGAWLQE